jgi:hypothetical protein
MENRWKVSEKKDEGEHWVLFLGMKFVKNGFRFSWTFLFASIVTRVTSRFNATNELLVAKFGAPLHNDFTSGMNLINLHLFAFQIFHA